MTGWIEVAGRSWSGALMHIRTVCALIFASASVMALGGCGSSTVLSGGGTLGAANNAADAGATTGSINPGKADRDRTDELGELLARVGLNGDNPNEEVRLGKRYFRSGKFDLAAEAFRVASQRHPRDAEAWIGLAVSSDRLLRFDIADRAYAQAVGLVGETTEILNDQGFSYMLRGDYKRSHKKLQEAEAKDPANPYVQANIRLLEDSYRERDARK